MYRITIVQREPTMDEQLPPFAVGNDLLLWGYKTERIFLDSITEDGIPLKPEQLAPLFHYALDICMSRASVYNCRGNMWDFMFYMYALMEACAHFERERTGKSAFEWGVNGHSTKDLIGYNPMDALKYEANGTSVLKRIEEIAMSDDKDGLAFGSKVLLYLLIVWGWEISPEAEAVVDAAWPEIEKIKDEIHKWV